MKVLIALVTISFCIGCKSSDPRISRHSITLQDIKLLNVGRSSSQEVSKQFGLPDIEMVNDADRNESWVYYHQSKTPRLSLSFDAKTKLLISIMWMVKKEDREYQAATVHEIFADRVFTNHSYSWQSADAIYSGYNSIDSSKSVLIELDLSGQNVKFILIKSPGEIAVRDGFVSLPPAAKMRVTADRLHPRSLVQTD